MLATRLSIVVLLGIGCTGQIEADLPAGTTPEQEAARRAWVAGAQPVLDTNCASCHGGSMPNVAWIEGGPDVNAQREDVLTYMGTMGTIVQLGTPQTSLLVKKGAHDGPALSAEQATKVVDWITKERDAKGMMNAFPIMLPPTAMMVCTTGAPGSPTCPYNEFPLDAAGATGAKVQFTMTDVGGTPYLANLKIIPGPMGVYAEHPLFVSVPAMGMPKLDPIDRYQTLRLNLPAGAPAAMQTLGNGTASYSTFATADPITVYFVAVGPMK